MIHLQKLPVGLDQEDADLLSNLLVAPLKSSGTDLILEAITRFRSCQDLAELRGAYDALERQLRDLYEQALPTNDDLYGEQRRLGDLHRLIRVLTNRLSIRAEAMRITSS